MRWSDSRPFARLWTIPADVAKSGRAHVVPLSPLATSLLLATPRFVDQWVLPARSKTGEHYRNFTFAKAGRATWRQKSHPV